jgi:type III restriction enzyme
LEALNKAYIYTNYNKNHIRDIKEIENGNKPPIYFTKRKESIEPIFLETVYHHRTDFNTLTPPPLWQKSFIKSLDEYFGIKENFMTDTIKNNEIIGQKIDLNQEEVNNQIIVDAEIESFDNFVNEIKEKGHNLDYHFSQYDIERLYNLLCFEELKKQEIEEAKYNPSRSWGQLKSALNVWFRNRLAVDSVVFYKIIVNELLLPNSELKKAIRKALIDFRETYNITIKEKQEKDIFELEIPEKENSFTDDFEELDVDKSVFEKFYLKKTYNGRKNEIKFIEFIDSQNVDWWHKQEDSGRNVFAIEYFDSQEKKSRLFYPDFIIKKDNKIYLLDTKSGITAKSQETADKNKALQEWIEDKKDKYSFEIIGGIIDFKHPSWRLNRKENYVYENESDWEELIFE